MSKHLFLRQNIELGTLYHLGGSIDPLANYDFIVARYLVFKLLFVVICVNKEI